MEEVELTVEQKLEIARQLGSRWAFHYTNTSNPVDFPSTEIEDTKHGDAAE